MNWLTRDTVIMLGTVITAILIGLLPQQYQSNITEIIESLVRLLLVVLFPEAAVRGFKIYQDAKVQIAQIQRLGPNIEGKFTTSGEGQDDQSTSYRVTDRT